MDRLLELAENGAVFVSYATELKKLVLLELDATQDFAVWIPPVVLQNLLYASIWAGLILVPLNILPPQNYVTGLELTGSVHILLPSPIEVYAFGAQKLENPLVLNRSRLLTLLWIRHLGSVQHLTRIKLGVFPFVESVPPKVAHLAPPALVPAIPIATLGPVPLKLPMACGKAEL